MGNSRLRKDEYRLLNAIDHRREARGWIHGNRRWPGISHKASAAGADAVNDEWGQLRAGLPRGRQSVLVDRHDHWIRRHRVRGPLLQAVTKVPLWQWLVLSLLS